MNIINMITNLFNKSREDENNISEIKFLESEDGELYFFTIYSNKYRDRDNAKYGPEIIAEQSHINFVKGVKSGKYDYPDLWHNHIPIKWGKAEWVAYDYDSGFALAAGKVSAERKEDAQKIIDNKEKLLVSHTFDNIKRSSDDPSVIINHVTKEISPVYATEAANFLTGFNLEEKKSMRLIESQKDYLKNVLKWDENEIDALDNQLSEKALLATAMELESKSKKQDKDNDDKSKDKKSDDEQLPEENKNNDDAQDSTDTDTDDVNNADADKDNNDEVDSSKFVTRDEVSKSLEDLSQATIDVLESFSKAIEEIRENQEKIKEEIKRQAELSLTPKSALYNNKPWEKFSSIGKKSTETNNDDEDLGSPPEENDSDKKSMSLVDTNGIIKFAGEMNKKKREKDE